jgi:hypothetical protein
MTVKLGSWFDPEITRAWVYLRVGKKDYFWSCQQGSV